MKIDIKFTEEASTASGTWPPFNFRHLVGEPIPNAGDYIQIKTDAGLIPFKVVERVFTCCAFVG